jgi:hypothetical protein
MGDGAYARANVGHGISFELPARRFKDGAQLEVSRCCGVLAQTCTTHDCVLVEGDPGGDLYTAVPEERHRAGHWCPQAVENPLGSENSSRGIC